MEAFDEISLSELEFRRAISKKKLDQHRQIILGTTERSEVDAGGNQILLECQARVEFCNIFLKSFQYRLVDDGGAPTPSNQSESEIPSISDILPWLLGEERSEVDQICLECKLTDHLQQLIDLCNRHFKNQLRLEMTDDDNGRTDDQQQQTVTTPGGEQAQ